MHTMDRGMLNIIAAIIFAVGVIIAAIIARPMRYKTTTKKGLGVVVLDMRTGIIYPNGTGGEPLKEGVLP